MNAHKRKKRGPRLAAADGETVRTTGPCCRDAGFKHTVVSWSELLVGLSRLNPARKIGQLPLDTHLCHLFLPWLAHF